MKRHVALECLGDCSHSRHVFAVVRELIVRQTVAIRPTVRLARQGASDSPDSVQKNGRRKSGANGVNHSQLWAKSTHGEPWADWAAYLTLVSVLLSLSMSAKYWAPSDPSQLELTLKTMAIWR